VASGGRCSTSSRSPISLRGVTRWPLGLAVILGVALMAVGCGANSDSGTSATDHSSRGTTTHAQMQGYHEPTAPSDSKKTPKNEETQSITGMNADAVMTTFLKPGLECRQQVGNGVLYTCSSEENHDLSLLYEGEITGRSIDQVSGVEARVVRQGTENFELASPPFLAFIATQLEYRGADKKRAYEFVNRSLSSGRATTTIGTARWTIETSSDSRVLNVSPAW
jgi:hypothetical protein